MVAKPSTIAWQRALIILSGAVVATEILEKLESEGRDPDVGANGRQAGANGQEVGANGQEVGIKCQGSGGEDREGFRPEPRRTGWA